jgi:multidrug resistance efflux pump
MLEFLACSLVTILPDYLFRRFAQGKRFGHEITLYSVWYELRWGITSCAILTVALITVIFFYHPTTSNVSSLFRTVTVLPEESGRVNEIFVENNQQVEVGQPLFNMVDTDERAATEIARGKVAGIDADLELLTAELAVLEGRIQQATGTFDQAENELARKREIYLRNSNVVSERELESLENLRNSTEGGLRAAIAERDVVETRIRTVLPAERAIAVSELTKAEAVLAKKTVYADVSGTLEQFLLQPGDIVSPVLRPAGVLVPLDVAHERFQAGFRQIASPVLKVGMIAEMACVSQPFEIIPMFVEAVQDVIPSGQYRPGDRLIDPQDLQRPGTVLVTLAPLYEGQAAQIPPGSKCIANAYTNSHELIASGELSGAGNLYYHMVDTVGIVQAVLLRVQAMILPVKILVLSGH